MTSKIPQSPPCRTCHKLPEMEAVWSPAANCYVFVPKKCGCYNTPLPHEAAIMAEYKVPQVANSNIIYPERIWYDASKVVPDHMVKAVVWVIGGYLIEPGDDGYLDLASYNARDKRWQVSSDMLRDDAVIAVSHWMRIEPPTKKAG